MIAAQTASAQSQWYITGSAGAYLRDDASRSTTFFRDPAPAGPPSGAVLPLGSGGPIGPIGVPNPVPPVNFGGPISGPGTNTTTYDPGAVLNVGVGYKLPLGFRVEGELGYAHYSADSVSPLSTNGAAPLLNGNRLSLQSGGNHNSYSATVNAFYDLPLPGDIVPYIGTGFGAVYSQAATAVFTGLGGVPRFTQPTAHSTSAAILAEVGLTIKLNANWSVVPSYRFEHLFTPSDALPDNANIFELGLRYSF